MAIIYQYWARKALSQKNRVINSYAHMYIFIIKKIMCILVPYVTYLILCV